MRNPPEEIVYTIVLAAVFFILLVVVMLVTIWRYYSRKRTHEMAVMQFERTRLETRTETQEQTFRRLTQQLHDNLGQILSQAKLNQTTARLDKPEEVGEKLNCAIDFVSQSIQSIR